MDPASLRAVSLWLVLLLSTFATSLLVPSVPTLSRGRKSSSERRRSIRTAVVMSGPTYSSPTDPPFSPETLAALESKGLEVRGLSEANLPKAVEIETASYPEDEAASPENMRFRRTNADDFFLEATLKTAGESGGGGGGGGEEEELVGFVCGTCSQGEELSHESMHLHDPNGQTLCIHSVVVAEKFRRRGYATEMLKAYVESVALTQPGVRRVCLIAKAGLLGMYASCGFSLKGLSPVVHGKDPWFEMRIDLDSTEPRLLRFVQVDAFSDRKFCGNPAAVFFTQAGGDADWMQKVAVEMNISETCFLELQPATPDEASSMGPTYALRWFTPGGEVDLCGHATLAAAFALWEEGRVGPGLPIRFSTASGVLTCRRDAEGWVAMDFPSEVVGDALPADDEGRTAIVQALGLASAGGGGGGEGGGVLFVGWNRCDVMVEVTPEAFSTLAPDMRMLAAIESRGFIVTCKGQPKAGKEGISTAVDGVTDGGSVDFQSRFFAPRMGIDEDPVTGSAHCCLAPYWASKLGRRCMVGYQASPRGGTVRATVGLKSEGDGRVVLEGKAVSVFRGLFRR
ncbi:unnamed protein product [Ectocarpus sp. 4 AP-2014]